MKTYYSPRSVEKILEDTHDQNPKIVDRLKQRRDPVTVVAARDGPRSELTVPGGSVENRLWRAPARLHSSLPNLLWLCVIALAESLWTWLRGRV